MFAFGAGAGAVVLSRSDEPGILASRLHADGRHANILSVPGTVSGGAISGAQPFTKTGPGTLVLTADNAYSGSTTVARGTLKIQGASGRLS